VIQNPVFVAHNVESDPIVVVSFRIDHPKTVMVVTPMHSNLYHECFEVFLTNPMHRIDQGHSGWMNW
jgi:hypothetical protein